MKKYMALSGLLALSHAVFAGESVGLIANLEGNIKNISLKEGVSKINREAIERSLQSIESYLEFSDAKLSPKFLPIKDAVRAIYNTVQIVFNKSVNPFKKAIQANPFEVINQKTIQNIEEGIKPLRVELKKVKGSFLSGLSLGKKSEAQKVINGTRDVVVKKIEEILKEFEQIKKTKIIN